MSDCTKDPVPPLRQHLKTLLMDVLHCLRSPGKPVPRWAVRTTEGDRASRSQALWPLAGKSPPPPRKTGGPNSGPLTQPVVTASMLTMGRPLKMGGNAWQYLTDSVAGAAELGVDAAAYYAAKGTPSGRFLGRGLDGLGPVPGSVKTGDVVSPEMVHRMLAQLADPLNRPGPRPDALDRAARPGGWLRPHLSSAVMPNSP